MRRDLADRGMTPGEDRPRAAKRAQADLYVEVHYNCAGPGNTESKGVETYCLTTAGANSTNGGSDGYPALKGNKAIRVDPANEGIRNTRE